LLKRVDDSASDVREQALKKRRREILRRVPWLKDHWLAHYAVVKDISNWRPPAMYESCDAMTRRYMSWAVEIYRFDVPAVVQSTLVDYIIRTYRTRPESLQCASPLEILSPRVLTCLRRTDRRAEEWTPDFGRYWLKQVVGTIPPGLLAQRCNTPKVSPAFPLLPWWRV
jgi:hypothetical protein